MMALAPASPKAFRRAENIAGYGRRRLGWQSGARSPAPRAACFFGQRPQSEFAGGSYQEIGLAATLEAPAHGSKFGPGRPSARSFSRGRR